MLSRSNGAVSQFHYGSIQTEEVHGNDHVMIESQFHYGSIQTNIQFFGGALIREVTIPLWFDSNGVKK